MARFAGKLEIGSPKAFNVGALDPVPEPSEDNPNELATDPVLPPPIPFIQPPSTPMSVASLWVTCMNTTLIRTWGCGRSRLEMTELIFRVVSSSAMIVMLCVSGS